MDWSFACLLLSPSKTNGTHGPSDLVRPKDTGWLFQIEMKKI